MLKALERLAFAIIGVGLGMILLYSNFVGFFLIIAGGLLLWKLDSGSATH